MAERLALFRADAGPAIGGGHVMRCLALAAALAGAGWRVLFAGRPGTREAVPALAGQPFLPLDGDAAAEPARLAAACPGGCDLLVVDHYHRDAGFEAACRPWARAVLAFDDAPGRPHAADFLLDQTVGRDPAAYEGWVPAGCRVLAGTDYVQLRPGFLPWRERARRVPDRAGRLLVTVGTGDPWRLSDRVLAALARPALAGLATRLVAGAAFPDIDALRRAAPPQVEILTGVTDLAPQMAWADLALTGAGSTCWEACFLGLPLLIVTLADNQRTIAARLPALGVARGLGGEAGCDPAGLAGAIAALAGDALARAAMARAGRLLVDGRGGARVVAAVEERQG